jgi:hypothetical protein
LTQPCAIAHGDRSEAQVKSMAEALKAGDKVKKSGVYSVAHEGKHAAAHEVTCIAGITFPPCDECGDAVRFTLVKHAKHIVRHEHFRMHTSSRLT